MVKEGVEIMPREMRLKGSVILSWKTQDSCLIFVNDHVETFAWCYSREQSLDRWDEFTETTLASYEEALLSKWTYPPMK